MTRSIVIIGVFVSMVEQISEFVLCEFPKSVAAKKLKILIFPFKMSKKVPSKRENVKSVHSPNRYTDFHFSNLISNFISKPPYTEVS